MKREHDKARLKKLTNNLQVKNNVVVNLVPMDNIIDPTLKPLLEIVERQSHDSHPNNCSKPQSVVVRGTSGGGGRDPDKSVDHLRAVQVRVTPRNKGAVRSTKQAFVSVVVTTHRWRADGVPDF